MVTVRSATRPSRARPPARPARPDQAPAEAGSASSRSDRAGQRRRVPDSGDRTPSSARPRRSPPARPRPRPPPASRPPRASSATIPNGSYRLGTTVQSAAETSAARSASGTNPANTTARPEPQRPGLLPARLRRPGPGDHHPQPRMPPPAAAAGRGQVLHALLVHQPAAVHDQRPVRRPPSPRRRGPVRPDLPARRVHPVGHHVHLARREARRAGWDLPTTWTPSR